MERRTQVCQFRRGVVEMAALLSALAAITVAAPRTQVGRVIWQTGLYRVVCSLPWAAGCWHLIWDHV